MLYADVLYGIGFDHFWQRVEQLLCDYITLHAL